MTAQFVDPALPGQPSGVAPAGQPAQAPSVLGQIMADFKAAQGKLERPVPGRPGYTVTFDPTIPWEAYRSWQLASVDPTTGIDELGLAVRALAAQCVSIAKDGQVLQDAGQTVTFDHPVLQQAFNTLDVPGTVRFFYGQDGAVIKEATVLLREAGYGTGGDPTRR